jgi:hypothetical protein
MDGNIDAFLKAYLMEFGGKKEWLLNWNELTQWKP